jgi:hypothetical protein
MSFLNSNTSEYLSARITQKGRNSIAKGDFNIEFFQVGDSEFDYDTQLSNLTGITTHQKVMAPFDKNSSIKYPYKLTTSNDSTTFGSPIRNSSTETIRNVMGPAGYVGNNLGYVDEVCEGSEIFCTTQRINFATLSGSTTISFTGETFSDCEFITLVLDQFGGSDPNIPVITGNSTSLIYKVISFTSGSTHTMVLDRPTPNITGLTGSAQIVCNKCEVEYPIEVDATCLPSPIDPSDQQNPWTLNVVWTTKPIGDGGATVDEELSGYTSNRYASAKEYFGYTSTGQTFTNFTGGTLAYPTSYFNSFNEQILVKPIEQRCVAIIHYSELGDTINDPERFFKYDDYISYSNNSENTVATNSDGDEITDTDYFEIFIPLIYYHRSTGTTAGQVFKMDTTNYYVRSTKNSNHSELFRYLIDEVGNKVGKVFPHNKLVIFDDQELVAILDYRSNRRFTLGAPKVSAIPSDDSPQDSLISGTTSQTYWVTYMLSNSNTASSFNYLPCNYFSKVEVNFDEDECNITSPSNISVRFSGNTFQHMESAFSGFTNGFIAKNFKVLIQETTDNANRLPLPNQWRVIDFTTEAGGTGTNYLNPTGLTATSFVINFEDYDDAPLFDLETYMGTDYLHTTGMTTNPPQFGDEQPFPGSVRLVRATDIEVFSFTINLPSTQFIQTQNPTYVSGNKYVTEVALLNSNKDVMVIAKTSTPIKRVGTQVFSVDLDF